MMIPRYFFPYIVKFRGLVRILFLISETLMFFFGLIDIYIFSVRAIVALNLHNYASGRNPWGQLKLDYMEKVSSEKY